MGRFEAVNGLVHLTFANEDVYYKNSLVRLNLRQNLYYELKQKDYEAVCFVAFENDKFQVKFGNDYTASLYEQHSGNAFGKFLKSLVGADSSDMPKALEYDNASEEFLNRILSMMKKEKKVAAVFSIEAMAALKNKEKAVEGFLEISKNNYNKNNLLLILAPTAVEGSKVHFEKEDGIFRTELFPVIKKIFDNYESVHFYERLKADMPNRISFMNEFDLDAITNLVSCAMMQADMETAFRPQDYAECIWYIYNSGTFYNWVDEMFCVREGFVFPVNPLRKYSVIEKAAHDEKMYRVLDNVILKIHELSNSSDRLYKVIPNALNLKDYRESDQQYLFWNGDTLQRIGKINCDWMKDKEAKRDVQIKLAKIRRALSSPYICSNNQEGNLREIYMDEYIDDALEAAVKRDKETFLTSVEAMHYIFHTCEEDTQKNVDKEVQKDKNNIKKMSMVGYRKILDCQKNVFELRKDINRDNRAFLQENEVITCIRKEILHMEQEYPDIKKLEQLYLSESGSKKEKPMLLTQYLDKKIAVRNKVKALQGKKMIIEQKQSEVTHMENAIRNIETSISGLGLSKGKAIHTDLDVTIEYIQSVFSKVSSLQKSWDAMDSAMDKVYEEAWNQSEEYRIEDYGLDMTLEEFELNEEMYSELL